MSPEQIDARAELPGGWAADPYWRTALHLLTCLPDDARIWAHVIPDGIDYPAILDEAWSGGERRVLQAAASLWDGAPVSLLDLIGGISDGYWQRLTAAIAILRDGLP